MATQPSPTLFERVRAFWRERKILLLSLLFAFGFLFLALNYQARQDVDASRYAVQRLTKSDPPIEILYRQYLWYDPSDKPGAPLIARLPDAWLKTWNNANAPTTTVPLTFVSAHLMFTDAHGNPTSGQMILSNASISQTVGTLYVRPKPIIGNAAPTATLGVILPPHTFAQPFDVTTDPNTNQFQPIFLETEDQSYWRNFWNHLLGENALALTVGIALVGWGVDWLWRRGEREQREREFVLQKQQLELNALGYKLEFEKAQSEKAQQELAAKQEQQRQEAELRERQLEREQKEKELREQQLERERERQYEERRRRLPPIREMMPNNPAYALKQFLSLEREAKSKKWDQSLLDAVEGFRAEFVESKQVQQQILRQAGKALTLEAGKNLSEILSTFREFFFTPSLDDAFTVLQRAVNQESLKEPNFQDVAHDAGLKVWGHFREDAGDLVRPLLLGVYEETTESKAKSLFENLNRNENKSLLRDGHIRQALEKKGCESQFWAYNYSWQDFIADGQADEDDALKTWFCFAHLQQNPFGCPEVGSDPLLLKTWPSHLEYWRLIKANRPLVCLGSDARDALALATHLLQQIRATDKDEQLHRTVFSSRLSLPFSDLDASATLSAYYEKVAIALSESWCELLAQNIDAYLDLDPDKQHIVAELLYWSSKSEEYLESRLRQAGMPDGAGGRMLLRRLHEKCGTGQVPGSPSEIQLHAWFNTRPKGLDKTFLITHAASPNLAIEARPFEKRIAMLADSLWKNNIVLKLFTTTNPGAAFTLPVQWSIDKLKEILDARINSASEPSFVGQRFSDFFDPNEKSVNVEKIMARCARGSLNRMLDLGNLILQARVNRGGITNEFDFYLTQQDLCAALKEFQRRG